jgi:hypothetical protein
MISTNPEHNEQNDQSPNCRCLGQTNFFSGRSRIPERRSCHEASLTKKCHNHRDNRNLQWDHANRPEEQQNHIPPSSIKA